MNPLDHTFRRPLACALPPDEFAAFDDPDYVKIVWNLRADPLGSVARGRPKS